MQVPILLGGFAIVRAYKTPTAKLGMSIEQCPKDALGGM
jgi:hypothetical protein